MKCKCQICKKVLDTKTAYAVEYAVNKKNGTTEFKNKYYCNEEEYSAKLVADAKAESDKAEMWSLVTEYIGKTSNTILFAESHKWGNPGKVVRLIKDNRDKFDFMNRKTFDSETAKIRYFSAIIKNNINDLPDIVEETPKVMETYEVHYVNKHKSKLRKGLLDDE